MPHVKKTGNPGNSVLHDLREVIAPQLGVDLNEVTLNASLTDDLGADSLDIVEVVMGVEEKFGLEEISDDVADKFKTVGDIVTYIEKVKGKTQKVQ